MAMWSSETIKQKLTDENLISPPDKQAVKHGAYELSLGPEAFITSAANGEKGQKKKLEAGEHLVIPPGQFGLLLTEERVTIPKDTIGFISIKAGVKFRGLVNVSGFHVDPGFTGRLKFSVYNAGSQDIVLARGKRVFLIWFSALDQPTGDVYNGEHKNQDEITANDVMLMQGEVASPAALKNQIEELQRSHEQRLVAVEKDVALWRGITNSLLFVVVGLLVSLVVGLLLRTVMDSRSTPSHPTTTSTATPQSEKTK